MPHMQLSTRMNKARRLLVGGAGCVFLIALVPLLFGTAAPNQSAVPPSQMPPLSSCQVYGSSWLSATPMLRAQVQMLVDQKLVNLLWYYSSTSRFIPGDGMDTFKAQAIPVSFWPTSAEVVAGNRIVVAGKERNGDTRVELWELDLPIVTSKSTPAGVTKYEIVTKPLKSITMLYSDKIPGRDTIRGMIALRGSSNMLLVQFHDSRDLYTLDWAAEPYALTLLSSASANPGLGLEFDVYVGGDHSLQGYCYTMSSISDLTIGPCYVLRDQNRDGVIDNQGPMPAGDWRALQLDRRDLYVEYGGLPWPE